MKCNLKNRKKLKIKYLKEIVLIKILSLFYNIETYYSILYLLKKSIGGCCGNSGFDIKNPGVPSPANGGRGG